jgi:hypothetical protein
LTQINLWMPASVLYGRMDTQDSPDRRCFLPAGVTFGTLLFGAGFVAGTVRTLFVTPYLGHARAVALEVPFMLAAGWMLSAWLIRNRAQQKSMPDGLSDRMALSALAFASLMSLEIALGIVLEPRSVGEVSAILLSPANRTGLLAQVLVCLFPVFQLKPDATSRRATP